jgi:hypothetical protein
MALKPIRKSDFARYCYFKVISTRMPSVTTAWQSATKDGECGFPEPQAIAWRSFVNPGKSNNPIAR